MSKINNTSYYGFMKNHTCPKGDNSKQITNTSLKGGRYHIPEKEYPDFLKLYYDNIVSKGREEFLTEKQLDVGPIAIDCDFRYKLEITEKQYNKKTIVDLIYLYLNTLKTIYQFVEDESFPVYVFEKPHVNSLEEKKITKDGIHMIIGIQSDRATQILLRKKIIESVGPIFKDIPLENSYEDVFDEGICKGGTNWQLYGSRKPDHESYKLTYAYDFEFDTTDGQWIEKPIKLSKFNWKEDFPKLSIRYNQHAYFFYTTEFANIHENYLNENKREPKAVKRTMVSSVNITNKEELDNQVEEFLNSLTSSEYDLKEAYELVMALPECFYGSGSYDRWMRVGWALCNISQRLFIVWVVFSAQSPDFDYSSISDLQERWNGFNKNGLTKRSLWHWAKENNPTKYKKIHENSVDYYLNQSIKNISLYGISKKEKDLGCGDADIAKILFIMYKDSFACAGLKADKWYRYTTHRWAEDEMGTSLRKHISESLRTLYRNKCDELSQKLCDSSMTEEEMKKHENLANKVLEIIVKLGQTTHKDHILKEAREMFYDPEVKFLDLLDSNPYLMCFKNGVLDMKNKVFRPGRADDYLEKCTNINYRKLDPNRDGETMKEINDFMAKLFPIEKLRNYMWQHLASILIGVNFEQKLHIYIGGGSNGKSVLTDLLSQCLGDYYAIVPLSLITQHRQKQGQASPDIVALKGLRFAVMQEPSKDDKINDGAMKELTSGVEPIKGRNLFSTPVTFIPQMKIAVCSNNFMKVNSQDHGTWRRIAVVDYMSCFSDNPDNSDESQPYQFKKDITLTEKFPKWREVFMSMLVEILWKTNGRVEPCDMVTESSSKYREREDHIAEFIREKVAEVSGGKITKTEINNEFNIWYMGTYGRNGPSTKEVHEYMDKRFGKSKAGGWKNVSIKYETNIGDSDDDDDEEEEEVENLVDNL